MVNENSVPKFLKKNPDKKCVVGLTLEPKRLTEVRKNRMNSLKENHSIDYTNEEKVELEILNAKKTFKKYQWPVVDVTRKSVEETAASIIKIYEIKRENG
jgi:regulator of PEP synthase PpsR (kinase-PPPase family)